MEQAPWFKEESGFKLYAHGECDYCLRKDRELNSDNMCEKCYDKHQEMSVYERHENWYEERD